MTETAADGFRGDVIAEIALTTSYAAGVPGTSSSQPPNPSTSRAPDGLLFRGCTDGPTLRNAESTTRGPPSGSAPGGSVRLLAGVLAPSLSAPSVADAHLLGGWMHNSIVHTTTTTGCVASAPILAGSPHASESSRFTRMKHGSVENKVTTTGDMSNGQPDGTTAVRSELGIVLDRMMYRKHTRGLAISSGLFSEFTQRGTCQGTVVGTVESTVSWHLTQTRVLVIRLEAYVGADTPASAGAQVRIVSHADDAVLFSGSIRDAYGKLDQVVLPAGTMTSSTTPPMRSTQARRLTPAPTRISSATCGDPASSSGAAATVMALDTCFCQGSAAAPTGRWWPPGRSLRTVAATRLCGSPRSE